MGHNDDFSQTVENYLNHHLPIDLQDFNPDEPYSNYLRIKYPELPHSMYELHFAKFSKNHAHHLGTGRLDLIALYFGDGVGLEQRLQWLAEMEPAKPAIEEKLGRPVVLGEWGSRWVWTAVCLQREPLERSALDYAANLVKFIEATYWPARQALQVLG